MSSTTGLGTRFLGWASQGGPELLRQAQCFGDSDATGKTIWTDFLFRSLSLNAVEAIKALRINSGPYTGGYQLAPGGRLQWYFANLALREIVAYLGPADLDFYVRVYLDLYLSKLETNKTIQDVNDPTGTPVPVFPDSHDAYAGTILALAVLYVRRSGNSTWWNANLATLKDIAFANLAAQQKPGGLFKVFQGGTPSDIGYLMDACEAVNGLNLFSSELTARGDADGSYYNAVAGGGNTGINSLWDATNLAYRSSDAQATATTEFYPGLTCQVFPRIFGIATESEARFDNAQAWLDLYAPAWWDGKYDPFPWMPLAAAARINGDSENAANHRQYCERLFAANRAMVTINELGWYIAATPPQTLALAGLNVTSVTGLPTAAPSTVAGAFPPGTSGFWLDAKPFTNFESLATGGSVLTAYGQDYGKWLDLSGNGNHAVEVNSADRGAVINDTWRYFAFTFHDLEVPNVGGSTTGFYIAMAVGLGSYYGTLFTDRGSVSANNGLRIYHSADGNGTTGQVGFYAGTTGDHATGVQGDTAVNPNSQVLLSTGNPAFANGVSSNVNVLEFWYDGTYLWGRKGDTVVRSVNTVTVTTGGTKAWLGSNNGSDKATSGVNFYAMVMTENFVPPPHTRDEIKAYLTDKAQSGGARGLFGHSLAAYAGTMTTIPVTTVTLTGLAMTSTQGTAGVDISRALTGLGAASARGTPGVSISRDLTGQGLAATQGTVVPQTGIVVALTGLAMTAAQGAFTVTRSSALTGLGTTAAGGTLTPVQPVIVNVALTGLGLATAQGTFTVTRTSALAGQGMTAARGAMVVERGVTLSGLSLISAPGGTQAALAIPLAGLQAGVTLGVLYPPFRWYDEAPVKDQNWQTQVTPLATVWADEPVVRPVGWTPLSS